jgi:peptidoglycan/xylan/chitin deacetylase (PgdA/CDA1 family)
MRTNADESSCIDAPRSTAWWADGTVLNLVFHGVADARTTPENDWWLERAAFERALDSLVGLRGIQISFDDGFASDAAIAMPALLERGLRADFFITTNWIGTPGHVSVEDIKQLADSGMSLGSHGMTHVRWTELTRGDLEHELAVSQATLAEITNAPVRAAACPRGAYDRSVIAAVRRVGFDTLFTTDFGTVKRDAYLQPRTLVYRSMIGPKGLRMPGRPSVRVRAKQALARWR